MINKSETINELATALSKAQGAIGGAIKDSTNPFFKSKYADLKSVWCVIREPLSANGLSIVQFPESGENGVKLETILMHTSGQWLSNSFEMPVMKKDAQAVGSAITYARRYALTAIMGVYQEDDDGNTATSKAPAQPIPQNIVDDLNRIIDVESLTAYYNQKKGQDKGQDFIKLLSDRKEAINAGK